MRRRSFLRLMAGGLAAALAPAFLNPTKLPELSDADLEKLIQDKMLEDALKTVDEALLDDLSARGTLTVKYSGKTLTVPIEAVETDFNGTITPPYSGKRFTRRYRFATAGDPCNHTEIGMHDLPSGTVYRATFPEPIMTKEPGYIDYVWNYYV